MRIRITHIDGKLPNLALMRLAHFHRQRGDEIYFAKSITPQLFEPSYDRVYGSAIFSFSQSRVAQLREQFPDAIVGGTHNTSDNTTVEEIVGADVDGVDYS